MKIILFISMAFVFTTAKAQNFQETVKFIQNKIECCAIPASGSTNKKVDSISINTDGNVILYYSNKAAKEYFNLFKLYYDDPTSKGIDIIMGGKFLQFYINEKQIRLIRFKTAADAAEVYEAFLRLISIGKAERKMFSDLNFKQTVDIINIRLSKWTEKSNSVKLTATEDGNILLTNGKQLRFYFNIFELISSSSDRNEGIRIKLCDPRTHAPSSWMYFNSYAKSLAFIRFNCPTPETELNTIKGAFVHLKSLCKKVTYYNKPSDSAVFFVNRNALISTENLMLKESIRAVDKKPCGDTVILINSNGEGWLDKDSLPIGVWSFHATDSLRNEYVFKTGTYQRTIPSMFEVTGIDSTDIEKDYHLTFSDLRRQHLRTVPFIKVGKWSYYHPARNLWKTLQFKKAAIPISTSELIMNTENPGKTSLIINLKDDRMDEWVDDY